MFPRRLQIGGKPEIIRSLTRDALDLLDYKNAVENELARIERTLGEKVRLAKINR